MSEHNSFTDFLVFGEVTGSRKLPSLDGGGRIILYDDEEIIREGDIKVNLHAYRSAEWKPESTMTKPARVVLTSHRLAFTWDHFKSDKGAGPFFLRRVAIPADERREGQMGFGGHVLHDWVIRVFAAHPTGLMRKTSQFRVDVLDGDTLRSVNAEDVLPDVAQQWWESYAEAVAGHRLAYHDSIKDEDRAVLDRIRRGDEPAENLKWAKCYDLPSPKKVGF